MPEPVPRRTSVMRPASGAAALNRASGKRTGTVATPRVGTGHRTTVEVGGALHIAVVTAPVAGVLPDSICSYNVTLDVTGAAAYPPGWTDTWDLGGLKLLDAGDTHNDFSGGLGYAEGILPSFAAPPATVEDLRLFHGSCFKLHGEGPSMMPGIDDILSDALPADATASKQRPHPPAGHRAAAEVYGRDALADRVAQSMAEPDALGEHFLRAGTPGEPRGCWLTIPDQNRSWPAECPDLYGCRT